MFTSTCSVSKTVEEEQRSQRGRGKTDHGIEPGGPAESHWGDQKAHAVANAEASVLEARYDLHHVVCMRIRGAEVCALRPFIALLKRSISSF